ncbi:hypothetical protein [Kitasatospora sp. MMS16-BH015]|uniref:hypothetical protein n=1 Tax=Kitasatospora sp. MMS16-BH015 TaxID=2018025 RepID=UPI00131A4C4B|nr:hypothetical protein [Kitasatospora sp. MMS16-BH015]
MTWIGVMGGYALGALVTARAVVERRKARFRQAGPCGVEAFERQERPHVEAMALCSGLVWIVALPLIVLGPLVAKVALARSGGGRPGTAPEAGCAARIDELERALGMGVYAGADLTSDT